VDNEKKKKIIRLTTYAVMAAIPVLVILSIIVHMNFIDPQTGFAIDQSSIPSAFNTAIAVVTAVLIVLSYTYALPFEKKKKKSKKMTNDSSDGNVPSEVTLSEEDMHTAEEYTELSSGNAPSEMDLVEETAEEEASAEETETDGDDEDTEEENSDTVFISREPTDGAALVLVNDDPIAVFITALLGFMLVLSAGITFFRVGSFNEDPLMHVTLYLSAIGGVYFILQAMRKSFVHSLPVSFLASFPAIWGAARMIMCFADLHNNANIETSFFSLMTSCSIMFFFYNEALFTLPIRAKYNLKALILFAQLTVMFVSLRSIPNIFLSCFWIFDFNTETIFSISELTAGIYAFMRLFCIVKRLTKEGYEVVMTEEEE